MLELCCQLKIQAVLVFQKACLNMSAVLQEFGADPSRFTGLCHSIRGASIRIVWQGESCRILRLNEIDWLRTELSAKVSLP